MKLKFNAKGITGLLLCIIIWGCDNYSELKDVLQKRNDELNPNGNRAFCYYIGDFKFPYIFESISENDNKSMAHSKEKLAVRLPIFVNIGLLSREAVNSNANVSNGSVSYKYSLTDEGRKYQYAFDRHLATRMQYENNFCFGHIVIQDVKGVKKLDYGNNAAIPKERVVVFYYLLENIPTWARSKELFESYNIRGENVSKDTGPYERTIRLHEINGDTIGYYAGYHYK